MPPGRPNVNVDFWIEAPDADKVTLRWSEDNWNREFEMTKDGNFYSKTLYPLKDGQRIEFKFLVWRGNEIEWRVNRQIRHERNAAGFENNFSSNKESWESQESLTALKTSIHEADRL